MLLGALCPVQLGLPNIYLCEELAMPEAVLTSIVEFRIRKAAEWSGRVREAQIPVSCMFHVQCSASRFLIVVAKSTGS